VHADEDDFYPEPVFVWANRDGFMPLNHRCNHGVQCNGGSDGDNLGAGRLQWGNKSSQFAPGLVWVPWRGRAHSKYWSFS
jgi:hypothetical protein